MVRPSHTVDPASHTVDQQSPTEADLLSPTLALPILAQLTLDQPTLNLPTWDLARNITHPEHPLTPEPDQPAQDLTQEQLKEVATVQPWLNGEKKWPCGKNNKEVSSTETVHYATLLGMFMVLPRPPTTAIVNKKIK